MLVVAEYLVSDGINYAYWLAKLSG
jgi:hypothetical protein